MKPMYCFSLVWMILLLALSGCSRQVSFEKDVMPIMSSSCLSCHDGSGEGSSASGFSVKNYADVMAGTKFGKWSLRVIVHQAHCTV